MKKVTDLLKALHFNPCVIATALLIALSVQSAYAQNTNAVKQLTVKSISGLKYIDTYVLPHNSQFEGTTVGGLSGIDYDPYSKCYYLICDDRSNINPSRFYTAQLRIDAKGIDSVAITRVDTLFQKDGSAYPKLARHATKTVDPEAMRYNAATKRLTWTSEGERIINATDTVLINPAISIISKRGRMEDAIEIPENLKMQAVESGPRRNGVLEGLTFANDYRNLYVSLEDPLYQDGPQAALTQNNAFTRIYKFDLNTKKNTAQYAYKLEHVAKPSLSENGQVNNGVTDILWLGGDSFMVTERSYSGGPGANIKVFLVSFKQADNILAVKSLRETPASHPAQKTLLLNMDDLGTYIDNVEGATLGPKLPNGHQSVVFVVDNNFSTAEKSQFLLFEVVP